jgi:hypothetical protein
MLLFLGTILVIIGTTYAYCYRTYFQIEKERKNNPSFESNEIVCRNFDNIRLRSQCQYAHKAKTYGAPEWNKYEESFAYYTLNFDILIMISKISIEGIELNDITIIQNFISLIKFFFVLICDRGLSLEENLESFLPSLRHYIDLHKSQDIDAFIIQITEERYLSHFNDIHC